MENLYNLIYGLCQKKGVSGGKMCTDIGMSRSFMTELKKGRANQISLPTAQKLSDYFGVPLSTFTRESEDVTEVEQIQDELFVKRKILFDLSAKASKEDLEKFIKMMNAIIDED